MADLLQHLQAIDLSVKVGVMRESEGELLKQNALRVHDSRVYQEGRSAATHDWFRLGSANWKQENLTPNPYLEVQSEAVRTNHERNSHD